MKSTVKLLSALLLVALLTTLAVPFTATAASAVAPPASNESTYNLFNSGLTGQGRNRTGSLYSDALNPAPATYTNDGYDIYVRANTDTYDCSSTAQLGLSFTLAAPVTEVAFLTVSAYDVDESSGEVDGIFLCDETAGTSSRVGSLSGMDEEWNTTSFRIEPSLFTVGHTYHFMIKGENSTWCVYVRQVSLNLSTGASAMNIDANAEIDTYGGVTVGIALSATTVASYTVELKALHVESNNQVGSYVGTISSNEASRNYTFSLESGAPEGIYQIDIIIKDAFGNTLAVSSVRAGRDYSVVNYHANGGSNNLPIDPISYSEGSTVTVLFDYIPSKLDHIFLGWARSSTATEPEFTVNGNNTFTMGESDVTLYAVWGESDQPHDHIAGDWVLAQTSTAVVAGYRYVACRLCGEIIEREFLPVLSLITVDEIDCRAGSRIEVGINIQNNPGIVGAILTLSYDPALTLVGIRRGGAWGSLNLTEPAALENGCRFVWDGVNADDTSNGTILTLVFDVPAGAMIHTEYDIAVSYSEGNIVNLAGDELDAELEAGSITIDEIIGDVNDDGIVNVADAIILRRYLSSGYNVMINETQADVNEDGDISIADVVALRKYIINR